MIRWMLLLLLCVSRAGRRRAKDSGDGTAWKGGAVQGGTFAAPIFKQFATKAYEGLEKLPFRAPAGIRMVRIDRGSGKPVFGTFPTDTDPKASVIWEAFKPETEPRRRARRSDVAPTVAPTATATQAPRDSDFLQREGGIY